MFRCFGVSWMRYMSLLDAHCGFPTYPLKTYVWVRISRVRMWNLKLDLWAQWQSHHDVVETWWLSWGWHHVENLLRALSGDGAILEVRSRLHQRNTSELKSGTSTARRDLLVRVFGGPVISVKTDGEVTAKEKQWKRARLRHARFNISGIILSPGDCEVR